MKNILSKAFIICPISLKIKKQMFQYTRKYKKKNYESMLLLAYKEKIPIFIFRRYRVDKKHFDGACGEIKEINRKFP